MNILGVDAGNTYYKTSKGIVLRAKVAFDTSGDGTPKTNIYTVKKDGRIHLIGDPEGELYQKPDKYTTEHFNLCLLTAIALSYPDQKEIHVKLVVGTPAGYFKQHATKYVEALRTLGTQTFNIGDNRGNIEIIIEDALCYIQSGISDTMIEQFDYPLLVLDFGGGTLDASLWRKGDDVNPDGPVTLDSKASFTQHNFDQQLESLVTATNAEYGTKYKPHELLQHLAKNELKLRTETFDLTKIKSSVLTPYVNSVISSLSQSFDLEQVLQVSVMGGPAKLLIDHLNKELTGIAKLASETPQLANAFMYQEAGEVLWAQ